MGSFYLNHNVLEIQSSEQDVLTKFSELIEIRKYLMARNYNLYVYSNLWEISILSGTLKTFIYGLGNRDEISVLVLSLMNTGPYYYEQPSIPLRINPSINNSSFANTLLEICFNDKQSLVSSLSDEPYLIEKSYVVNSSNSSQEVENYISLEGLYSYFENEFTPISINDVFNQIEELHPNIIILDSAKKSSQRHNFMGKLKEVYTVLITLVDVELIGLNDGINSIERKRLFLERTGFEISEESELTLQIRKYRSEREFKIPDGRKLLFEWHIKIGHSTRIHYYIDKDNQKIYIGHCGKHLGTATYNS